MFCGCTTSRRRTWSAQAAALSTMTIYVRLLREGFLVGLNEDANLIRFYPPLTIEEESIDRLFAVLGPIVAEIAEKKEREA